MEAKQPWHFSAAMPQHLQDGLSTQPPPSARDLCPGEPLGEQCREVLAKFLRICVCSQQQKSTLACWKDKRSRAIVCQLSLVCCGSMELPALSSVPATMLRATPYPPAPLSLSSPQPGEKKAAPPQAILYQGGLIKDFCPFFFFNNEAKIKILYFHYYPFSQPAEQKHKALLLLPLAPQLCLFLPWSSIKERRKLKLFYARRLQHAYLIFMMDLNC